MEEKKGNIVTHSMYAGLILGVSTSFLNIIGWSFPIGHSFLHMVIDFSLCFITLYCVFRYTKSFNNEVLNGSITYFKALQYGMHLFFFAAMWIAAVTFFYFTIKPEVLESIMNESIAALDALGNESSQNTSSMAQQLKAITAKDMALSFLWGYTFIGFILSLITSISFRAKNNTNKTTN